VNEINAPADDPLSPGLALWNGGMQNSSVGLTCNFTASPLARRVGQARFRGASITLGAGEGANTTHELYYLRIFVRASNGDTITAWGGVKDTGPHGTGVYTRDKRAYEDNGFFVAPNTLTVSPLVTTST